MILGIFLITLWLSQEPVRAIVCHCNQPWQNLLQHVRENGPERNQKALDVVTCEDNKCELTREMCEGHEGCQWLLENYPTATPACTRYADPLGNVHEGCSWEVSPKTDLPDPHCQGFRCRDFIPLGFTCPPALAEVPFPVYNCFRDFCNDQDTDSACDSRE